MDCLPLWVPLRQLKRRSRLSILVFASIAIVIYLFRFEISDLRPLSFSNIAAPTGPGPNITEFWRDFAGALSRSEPNASQIQPRYRLQRDQFDPYGRSPRLGVDITNVPEVQLDSLEQTHAEFLDSIRTLAPRLPFTRGSRGIVMTADSKYLGVAITSLLMLRRSGSTLSVELFLDSTTEHGRRLCDQALSELNARCFNMDDFFRLPDESTTTFPKLTKYQFKVFALLFSSFQDILFLDADAFPVHKPDHLLRVEPFKSHGLVTWPDFWLPTVSPLFYKIARVEAPPPPTLESRSTESGIMLYDKSRHADSLLLAAYYNLYGPKFYYPLLTQGAWGQGDKETFRLSANVLGKPVWHVTVPPKMLSLENVHYGSGIRQVDPEQDWLLRSDTQEQASRPQKGRFQGLVATQEMAKRPRWLFAHTNRVKIDARHLSSSVGPLIFTTQGGRHTRLWGNHSETIIAEAGYDIEKAVWEGIIKANCARSFLEECESLRDYYDSVFVL